MLESWLQRYLKSQQHFAFLMYYEVGHEILFILFILRNVSRSNKIQARITPATDAVLPITVWRRKSPVKKVTG